MYKTIICLSLTCLTLTGFSQKPMPLWESAIPYNIKGAPDQEVWRPDQSGVNKVSIPTLYPYLLKGDKKRPAVVICPGGGYAHLAIKKEGFDVAEWFNRQGIHAFVLKYRLPSPETASKPYMAPIADSKQALYLLHENAEAWGIDTDKIGIMGFSAGGHLAASTSTLNLAGTKSVFPNFSILIYPVVSMENEVTHKGSQRHLLGETPSKEQLQQFSLEQQIHAETPMTFLVHSSDDRAVVADNSIQYYQALLKADIPAELHLYQYGGHGYGMLPDKGYLSSWPERLADWLKRNELSIVE